MNFQPISSNIQAVSLICLVSVFSSNHFVSHFLISSGLWYVLYAEFAGHPVLHVLANPNPCYMTSRWCYIPINEATEVASNIARP